MSVFLALVVLVVLATASLTGTLLIMFLAFLYPSWLQGIRGKKRFFSWIILSALSVSVFVFLGRVFYNPEGCYSSCSGENHDLYRALLGFAINSGYLLLVYLMCTKWIKVANDDTDDSYGDEPYFQRVAEFPPTFLSQFDTKLIKFTEMGVKRYRQEDRPDNVCRQLVCNCGEEKLQLLVPYVANGWFQRFFTGLKATSQPLVSVFCPSCKSTQLAFDQHLHGWDAMFDDVSVIEREQPQVYNTEPSRVYVGLSYYWLNCYEQAVSENKTIGVDLENYIDHIDFFLETSKNTEFIFGFSCASPNTYRYDS